MPVYNFYINESEMKGPSHWKPFAFASNEEMLNYLHARKRVPLRCVKITNSSYDVLLRKKGPIEKWFNCKLSSEP